MGRVRAKIYEGLRACDGYGPIRVVKMWTRDVSSANRVFKSVTQLESLKEYL